MTKNDFIQLVIDWNQGSPHTSNIIPDIEWHGERNIRFGKEGLWLDIEEYRNHNTIAVRYEKKEEDGIIWDTDYVMNFNSMKMAVRLDRSYTAEALDADPKFSTPHFITMLIEGGYLKNDNGLPIQRKATVIDRDNLELLVNVINGEAHYKLPVVYVSKTYYDEDPINIQYLASRLKGVAHVMTQKGGWINSTLRKKCNDQNEYHGAIGIYYPTKAFRHRTYFYRSAIGYDSFLLEKVFRAVIQYSNTKMVDTLLTWQGVNNALWKDRFISQRQERKDAEEARRIAELKVTKLLDTRDEAERAFREQALEDARTETNNVLDSFEEDMQKLQYQNEALSRANEALEFENQGLRAKLDSIDSVPVLHMGEEFEFYQGEIKDILLSTLSKALKDIPTNSRRADVINDIIERNDYQKLTETKAEEVKRILKSYKGMSAKMRQALIELGFEITEDGKHYKMSYYGDGRYQTALAKTPSDGRAGKNSTQTIINMVF